jgi:hypothetical protein
MHGKTTIKKPISRFFFPQIQCANVAYFQRKIQLSGIYAYSDVCPSIFFPDKWSYTVLNFTNSLTRIRSKW